MQTLMNSKDSAKNSVKLQFIGTHCITSLVALQKITYFKTNLKR